MVTEQQVIDYIKGLQVAIKRKDDEICKLREELANARMVIGHVCKCGGKCHG